MNIKIKQHDIRDCGAACLTSIAAYYKLDVSIAKVRQYACTDKQGTNVLGLIKAAEKLGFTAKGVRGKIDVISKIPYPTIAHIVRKSDNMELYHFVVLYGYKGDTLKIMDPGTGEIETVQVDDFAKEWSGVLVLIEPSETFTAGRNIRTSLVSHFWELAKPHRKVMFQAFVGALCYTALGLSTSIYIEKITDYVLVGGNTRLLNLLSIVMIAILVLRVVIGSIQNIIMVRTGQLMDSRLILGYYKHLLKLPQSFFDTMQIGEITSRMNDAVKIRNFINTTIITLVVNVLILILSSSLMFLYYWKLALLMVAIIPIYLIIYIITDSWNKKIERKVMEHAAGLESQLVESLNAEKTIKQFGMEEYANEKTENRFIRMMYSVYTSIKNSVFSSNATDVVSRLFTIILMWVGCYYVLNGIITAGELMSFYTLVGYFTSPASSLISANKSIREATIAADRLFEIMDLDVEENINKVVLLRENIGDIKFENVDFSYGTRRDVLSSFNMQIKKGEMTAIVGESGSGKTTIANLVQNLYPLNGGQIMIGDYQLCNLTNDSVRKLVASVPQQITLFSGNIIENIALGEYEPNMSKIHNLISLLGLNEFINSLPKGLETQVGENGSMLSGGQKQRIAIARALYNNPEILILDEATSSLDSSSEKYVYDTMKLLRSRGATIIVIAHRLSTIKNADVIYVMGNGKIAEYGSFKYLISREGEFKRLWNMQTI